MPQDVTARHRAGGVGRLIALRAETPRHSSALFTDDTVLLRPLRPRRWPWAFAVAAVAAVLMLAALAPFAFREPAEPRWAVPLPAISIPAAPTATPAPTGTRPARRAVRQARKLSPTPSTAPTPATTSPSAGITPVLLGPAQAADLPALLGAYCRAAHGSLAVAATTADGWVCLRFGRGPSAIDMDAMCRWRYGAAAWADLAGNTDAGSWRCYRDGP